MRRAHVAVVRVVASSAAAGQAAARLYCNPLPKADCRAAPPRRGTGPVVQRSTVAGLPHRSEHHTFLGLLFLLVLPDLRQRARVDHVRDRLERAVFAVRLGSLPPATWPDLQLLAEQS